jgi:hypothetical protein
VPPDYVLTVIGDGDNDQSSKAREKKGFRFVSNC